MATSGEPSHWKDEGVVEDEGFQNTCKRHSELVQTLPKRKDCRGELFELFFYQDFGILLVQDHFRSKPDDIILATYLKSGTTWFRALIFTIINRKIYDFATHPLLDKSPHDLCPFLEHYMEKYEMDSPLDALPSPRFLSSHIPYPLLPQSATSTTSGCRFVYVFRNPKDVFTSMWHFFNKIRFNLDEKLPPLPLEDLFEEFCQGIISYGPYWDQVLSYWKASLEAPKKVLFLKYEDMKKESLVQVKRLAEFLGMPFTVEEKSEGVVEEIIRLCSFQNLSNLEVNQNTKTTKFIFQNSDFFRKGEIGDWKNYLTLEMAARLEGIIKDKFQGPGLSFD